MTSPPPLPSPFWRPRTTWISWLVGNPSKKNQAGLQNKRNKHFFADSEGHLGIKSLVHYAVILVLQLSDDRMKYKLDYQPLFPDTRERHERATEIEPK